jgi:hypothetical protein
MSQAAQLPNDVEALKAELIAARAIVIEQKIELEKLRFEIACLKRAKYGRSSEQLDARILQMQLTLEDLEATLAQTPEPLSGIGERKIQVLGPATSSDASKKFEAVSGRCDELEINALGVRFGPVNYFYGEVLEPKRIT